ncbi:MAG: 50S ribosome-binding protein YggL [Desulfobacterales bacterium]|nr:50S ribosome-binding protein YggL [Desulfobacterales bacterium]
MRKRLRKKRHLGEFREFTVELKIELRPGTDFIQFLNDWIENAVEANGLQFGGGGKDLTCSGTLEIGRRPVSCERVQRVKQWLADHRDVAAFQIEEPADARRS